MVLGFKSMALDFGRTLQPRIFGDATAASGIGHRRGAGRVRHLETKTLWLQRHITERAIVFARRPGKELVADLGTKYLNRADIDKNLIQLQFVDLTQDLHR